VYTTTHSDVGKALGVLALLASILGDPNPGQTLGDLVAGVGILIGALVVVGILIQLWSISPVLVGLAAAGCFLLNQRFTSTRLRQAVAAALGRRAYYLTELALAATPQELAAVADLWDGAGVSFTTHDTVSALETRWDTRFLHSSPHSSTGETMASCADADRTRNTAVNGPPPSTSLSLPSRSPPNTAVSSS